MTKPNDFLAIKDGDTVTLEWMANAMILARRDHKQNVSVSFDHGNAHILIMPMVTDATQTGCLKYFERKGDTDTFECAWTRADFKTRESAVSNYLFAVECTDLQSWLEDV